MDLEIKAEMKAVKQAKAYGWKVYKLAFLGVRGAPDRLFGKDRRAILIEFKREGEKPSQQQFIRHQEIRDYLGLQVTWTDNYEEACEILGIPP